MTTPAEAMREAAAGLADEWGEEDAKADMPSDMPDLAAAIRALPLPPLPTEEEIARVIQGVWAKAMEERSVADAQHVMARALLALLARARG